MRAALLRGLAFPIGDDAAGAGDNRDQGGDVVGLQLAQKGDPVPPVDPRW
jgi:hypothetical protein